MNTNTTKYLFRGIVILAALTAVVLIVNQFRRGPQPTNLDTGCPKPPPTTASEDLTNALKLVAQFKKETSTNASLEIAFREVAKTGFATVSDKNTTLLILINGAKCLLESGKIAAPMADKLIDAAYKLVLAEYGVAGHGAERVVTEDDRQALSQGKGANEIFQLLKEHSYRLAWEKQK